MKPREVHKIITGTRQTDGAGVRLVRVIGHADVRDFDPFLMLDAFDSTDPNDYVKGFPWHPHRGIETVTYLIEGRIEHGDSLGHKGVIDDGCCQWMTAGGGIIHQEMPQAAPRMRGLQLWLNLPAKDKMIAPKYRDLRAENIPVVRRDGAAVSVLAGDFEGTAGTMRGDFVDATMLDVQLAVGAKWSWAAPAGSTAFLYIVEGDGAFGGGLTEARHHRAVLFSDGESVDAVAGASGLRFVLFSGRPLREPVAWGGPIVMNTQQELRQAFDELDRGTFLKTK